MAGVCFKYCCGGTDFSKELSFITGHINAGALYVSWEVNNVLCERDWTGCSTQLVILLKCQKRILFSETCKNRRDIERKM